MPDNEIKIEVIDIVFTLIHSLIICMYCVYDMSDITSALAIVSMFNN